MFQGDYQHTAPCLISGLIDIIEAYPTGLGYKDMILFTASMALIFSALSFAAFFYHMQQLLKYSDSPFWISLLLIILPLVAFYFAYCSVGLFLEQAGMKLQIY
ncbi:hypothetical protein [Pantoea sp. BAV 3049]|uniref:hypothetical protein n=1 Tax=Pantoea sp. BAV 3049 TaxID=2654188 RepID=UPI00131B12E0|nr:hypothetical protein [Pantoea sp. BAV 3049]